MRVHAAVGHLDPESPLIFQPFTPGINRRVCLQDDDDSNSWDFAHRQRDQLSFLFSHLCHLSITSISMRMAFLDRRLGSVWPRVSLEMPSTY